MLPGFKLNLSGSGVFFCGRPRRPYQPRPTRPLRLCQHPWTGLSYRQRLDSSSRSYDRPSVERCLSASGRPCNGAKSRRRRRRRRSKRLMTSGNGTRTDPGLTLSRPFCGSILTLQPRLAAGRCQNPQAGRRGLRSAAVPAAGAPDLISSSAKVIFMRHICRDLLLKILYE